MPTPTRESEIATALICEFEGFREWPYPDPASPLYKRTKSQPWGFVDPMTILSKLPAEIVELSPRPITIGYGRTHGVNWATPKTTEAAERVYVHQRVMDDCEWLYGVLPGDVPLDVHEVAALLSIFYNIGRTAFAKSTLLKKLRRGDKAGAANEFLRWVNAGGMKLDGLETRRKLERRVFLGEVAYHRDSWPDGGHWVTVKP